MLTPSVDREGCGMAVRGGVTVLVEPFEIGGGAGVIARLRTRLHRQRVTHVASGEPLDQRSGRLPSPAQNRSTVVVALTRRGVWHGGGGASEHLHGSIERSAR